MHGSGNAGRAARGRPRWRRRAWPGLTIAALSLAGSLLGAARPTLAAQLSDFGEPFHFLSPLGPEAGDPSDFDGTLLDGLTVSICRVEAATCKPVKTLTSASNLSERLRIGPENGTASYYIANWDTSKVKLAPSTFRVSVTIARLQLGATDVTPSQYRSFGRTWPIKFRIENDPTIRVRVLHAAGKSASQVANAIRIEFQLGPEDVTRLLASDLEPFSDEDIELAISGVFQPAEVPPTTKIADPATQDALTSFDPATGTMSFSGSTPTLGALHVDDVLIGEPSAAAPAGFLRKVTALTTSKKGGPVVVETTQARIDEAVSAGTLAAAGALHPEDVALAEAALPGVTFDEAPNAPTAMGALDVGDGFDFHESIDVTLDGAASGGGVSGVGTVRIQGQVKFNAGWNVGFGVETCAALPPVCVDRFETHVGVHAFSDLRVSGTFDGHLQREVVLSTHYFKPVVFFIGPVPVVIVPVVKAIAGVKGDAHVEFSFAAQVSSDLDIGAKWTDPDDGGVGWQDASNLGTPTGQATGDLDASMELRAYAMADAKLLLYGVAGPGLAGRVGVGADVKFPRDPLWYVFGHASGELNFAVDIGGVLTLAEYHTPLPEVRVDLAQSANQPPSCAARTDPIPVAKDAEVRLGPREGGLSDGYFDCNDPEGEAVSYSGRVGSTPIDLAHASWTTEGTRVVTVTATDESNVSRVFDLTVNVIDTPPLLSVTTATGSVPASVQYFVTASAFDVEEGDFLPCTSLTWEVTGGTATEGASNRTCTTAVVFSQTGPQTITVTATDPSGKSSVQIVNVTVTSAPADPAPVIELDSFDVVAASGPKAGCPTGEPFCIESCPTGFFCPAPMDAFLYNGSVGDFHGPLTLRLVASDPNGDDLTVQWSCQVGLNAYPVTDNGDGTFTCDPYSASITQPILIRAEVSDGVTTVHSEVRRFYMLDRVA